MMGSTVDAVKEAFAELGGDLEEAGLSVSTQAEPIAAADDAAQLEADADFSGQADEQNSRISDQAHVDGNESPSLTEPLLAPTTWSASAKEAFAKVPREVQQIWIERDREQNAEYTRKTQELSTLRRTYAEIDEAFKPFADTMAISGVSPGAMVKRFLAWNNRLQSGDPQAFADLAASFGYSLPELVQQATQSPAQVDPAIQAIHSELSELRTWKTERESREAQQQAQAREAETTRAVEQFFSATDEQGNLLRPHFKAVWKLIGPLAEQLQMEYPQASLDQVLDEAYRQVSAPFEALKKQEITRKVEHAKNARAAGSSISGSSNGPLPKPRVKNTLDAVRQAAEQLHIA